MKAKRPSREGIVGIVAEEAYANVATISLDLPPGVTFTSASGVFLPQPLEEVAEPAALAGFAPALAGLVFLRRCRMTPASWRPS